MNGRGDKNRRLAINLMRNDAQVMSERIKPPSAAAAPCRLFVRPNVMTNMGGHFWLKSRGHDENERGRVDLSPSMATLELLFLLFARGVCEFRATDTSPTDRT